MTDGRRFRWTLVCEDRSQERFFSKLGERVLGREREEVRIAPKGQGAAWAWVLAQYPNLVRKTVRRYPKELVALVAVVDGDQEGFRRRKQRFDETMRAASIPERGAAERVAICVPTWNIETWIGWLSTPTGSNFDESRSFKDEVQKALVSERIRMDDAIAGWGTIRPNEEGSVPSLADCRSELQRLVGPS